MGVFSKSVRTFLCSGFLILVAGVHIYESLQCAIDRQRLVQNVLDFFCGVSA
jgi:hypothetical protein